MNFAKWDQCKSTFAQHFPLFKHIKLPCSKCLKDNNNKNNNSNNNEPIELHKFTKQRTKSQFRLLNSGDQTKNTLNLNKMSVDLLVNYGGTQRDDQIAFKTCYGQRKLKSRSQLDQPIADEMECYRSKKTRETWNLNSD